MSTSNVVQLPVWRKSTEATEARIQARLQVTDRITLQMINNEPVVVKGIEYTIEDVLVGFDVEDRERFHGHVLSLLQCDQDQEPDFVSRLNRFLIAGTRELAFKLSADVVDELA